MGDKKLDNIADVKADLLKDINANAQKLEDDSLITKEGQSEDVKSSDEQTAKKTPEKKEEIKDVKEDEKYEGKSVEEVIAMHKDATKKITELSQKPEDKEEKKPEDKEEKKPEEKKEEKKFNIDEDALNTFKGLFSGKEEEKSTEEKTKDIKKVEKDIVDDDDLSDPEKSNLLKEVKDLKELILADKKEAAMSNQVEQERLKAKELLVNDKVLPWNDDVESLIEKEIFSQMPALKKSQGGYIVAHTLLKGLLSKSVSVDTSDKDPKVAKETKQTNPGDSEYNPAKEKDPAKLRAYLANKVGVAKNYNRT